MVQLDFAILDWIAAHLYTPLLDWLMPVITEIGDGMVWVALGLLLLCIPKTRNQGAVLLLALLLNYLCVNVFLKHVVARTRPFLLRPEITLLVPPPMSYSFPSGHTSAAFAMAMSLFRSGSKRTWPLFILAALVGFSRLYLYVHFPTDVLAGALLGCAAGYLSTWIFKAVALRRAKPEGSEVWKR